MFAESLSVLHDDVSTTSYRKGSNMEYSNTLVGTTGRSVLLAVGCDCATVAGAVQCWGKARDAKRRSQATKGTQSLPSRRALLMPFLSVLVVLCGCATKTAESFLPAVQEQRPPNTARIYAHTGLVGPFYWIDWGEGAPRNAMVRAWKPNPSGYRVVARHYALPPDSNLVDACSQALSGTIAARWELTKAPPIILRPQGDTSHARGFKFLSYTEPLETSTERITDETGTHDMSYVYAQARSGQAHTLRDAFAYKVADLVPATTKPGIFGLSRDNCGMFVFSSQEAFQRALPKERGGAMAATMYTARGNLIMAVKKHNGTTEWLSGSAHYGRLNFMLQDDQTNPGQGFVCSVPAIGEETPDMFTDACIIGHVGFGGTIGYDRPPGIVDLDAFASDSSVGVCYFTTPVRFRVEAGKTYHVTWNWNFKFDVREEPGTDR